MTDGFRDCSASRKGKQREFDDSNDSPRFVCAAPQLIELLKVEKAVAWVPRGTSRKRSMAETLLLAGASEAI